MVTTTFNFDITADGAFSRAFLDAGAHDFISASAYIRDMPYGRNADKYDLLTVFSDGCATCSTKHAVLKKLVDEHDVEGVQLILCMFQMTAENTPSVKNILERTGLPYMLEAHNYLRINGEILDVTKKHWSILQFMDAWVEEHEIQPEQITDYKVAYQKAYLKKWLEEHDEIKYSLEELFAIREECIKALYS